MRAVIQRVKEAKVIVDGATISSIAHGFLVLLGVTHDDSLLEATTLADKLYGLRIFEDDQERMNLSIEDIAGEILVVSQFTLYGDCRKGRRPSFIEAAAPDKADKLYQAFCLRLKERGAKVQTGSFGAKSGWSRRKTDDHGGYSDVNQEEKP